MPLRIVVGTKLALGKNVKYGKIVSIFFFLPSMRVFLSSVLVLHPMLAEVITDIYFTFCIP